MTRQEGAAMLITERIFKAHAGPNGTLKGVNPKRRKPQMIRGKLWFRCAAMHDPVTPVVVQPALIGWEAKKRQVALQIERSFNGEELLRRMKGWVTVDPIQAIDVVSRFGRLKVLDDRELVIETEGMEEFEGLQKALLEAFGGEVDAELIPRREQGC